jgi:hypothetical protein
LCQQFLYFSAADVKIVCRRRQLLYSPSDYFGPGGLGQVRQFQDGILRRSFTPAIFIYYGQQKSFFSFGAG